MSRITIKSNLDSPQSVDAMINLWVEEKPSDAELYKFIIGRNGKWETIKDYNENAFTEWIPKNEGNYIIMAQVKAIGSTKAYDYVSKMNFIIGTESEKLISNLYLDKDKFSVGEKLVLTAETTRIPVLFRFWVKENNNWLLVKDYSAENTLLWSVRKPGSHEILVECKNLNSKKTFDDFQKINYQVDEMMNVEIVDFKVLNHDLIAENELTFKVDSRYEDNRMILYKFNKIDENGIITCIQDFSTNNVVSYKETESGKYKLLCLAKDMYSEKEYDDRALINYFVKPYRTIIIHNFLSAVSSPQTTETPVMLKAIVTGGKNLLYRFFIEGEDSLDSGYIQMENYLWKPEKKGKYEITLWVRDKSYEGSFEQSSRLEFIIDEFSDEPIQIKEVIIDKLGSLITGEPVKVTAVTDVNLPLRYRFIVTKEDKEIERINYGTCNWATFTPYESGSYKIEVQVRNRFSKRDYDSHHVVYFEVFHCIPANIDYVLLSSKDYQVIGDLLELKIITQKTKEILVKYNLKINGRSIEEIEYNHNLHYSFTPLYSGIYVIEIFAKNVLSQSEFDSKKTVEIIVHEAIPVANTKIKSDKINIELNEPVIFTVDSVGGKEVLYEFYIMENGEWSLVQKYSRNKMYSFIAFSKGNYKILVLSKSQYSKESYEDFDELEFIV